MIGYNIKRMRHSKRMLQQELADALGVSKSTVGMWETDKREPNIETINRIAEVLGCSVSYLIEDNRKTPTSFYVDYSGWKAADFFCENMFGDNPEEEETARSILEGLIALNLKGLHKVNERIHELEYIPDCNKTGLTAEKMFGDYKSNNDE